MNRNLLIIGAGIYGLVVKEIAQSTHRFDHIAFIDDGNDHAPDGTQVIGTTKDLVRLSDTYSHAAVAIGNPDFRKKIIQNIEENTPLQLASLVSPHAYIAPSAQLGPGCIIEPMSVVHSGCTLGKGCLICAGAVVNHASSCEDYVQIDCNATVAGYTTVPSGTKVQSGSVYQK